MKFIKKKSFFIKENKVTDKKAYLNRRKILKGIGSLLFLPFGSEAKIHNRYYKYEVNRPLTKLNIIKKYNNFFEFGTSKQIWKSAQKLNTDDWKIQIEGGKFDNISIYHEDLLKFLNIEERIYRFRCVEAWSMVVPWEGYELSQLIKYLEPDKNTNFIEFETFYEPKQAFNQNQTWYPWPYRETITIQEAMNPLTFIATGVYGQPLPKQNGAPLRIVIPWKYGFKSIKSIKKIKFLKKRNPSFWEVIAPKEYGFWANVNPNFPHRRWSQKEEKDIGTGKMYPTKLYNGYQESVEHLYKGIDKKVLFF